MAYANPDAVTSIGNGVSTTTYAHDNNGNLTSSGTGHATTTYTYDYANRLIGLFAGGATTTYGYDAFGSRVLQTGTTTTYIYPNKFYSVASSTGSATSLTNTEHVFNGDTLLSTIDNTSTTTSSGGGGGSISTSTPAYVQSKLVTVQGGTSNSVTLTNPVTTGDLILVGITVNNQTVASNAISDNKGNTYIKASESINGLNHAAVFYAKNVTRGSSFIVTSNIGDNSLSAHEYSGVSTSSPLDKVSTSTGTSITVSSGNVTTLLDNELYFGLAWSGGDGDTWTAGSGYTKREEQTNDGMFERMASEDMVGNASTTAARFTISASVDYAANIVTLKPLVTVTSGGDSSTSSPSTIIRYIHPDHLGSTNVVTDASGTVVQTLDYYPYGGLRLSVSNGANEKRQYIDQFSDDSGLNYLNARYMDPSRGQFMTEEPIFLSLGDPMQVRQRSQQDQQTYLTDPQQLNSYSYGRDNPISRKDQNGQMSALALVPTLFFPEFSIPIELLYGGAIVTGALAEQYLSQSGGVPRYIDTSLAQATKGVSGQGNNIDPEFGGKLPDGMWGRLIKGGLVVGGSALAFEHSGLYEYLEAASPDSSRPAGNVNLSSPTMVSWLKGYFSSTLSQSSTYYISSNGQVRKQEVDPVNQAGQAGT